MATVKATDLRKLSKEELEEKLADLRRELLDLRIAKVVAGRVPEKLNRLSNCQKDIARVLTVINENARAALDAQYKDRRYKPKCLRGFSTRAMRRALTPKELSHRPRKARCHDQASLRKLYVLAN